jgi:hypothetical protein
MTTKYTKWPYTLPNENKMDGLKIYPNISLQDTPKFTQIDIFGLKIFHLATLLLSG